MKFLHSSAARTISYILLLVLLGGLLVSQGPDLLQVWRASRNVHLTWVVAGCLAMAVSVLCTGAVYRSLTPQNLALRPLLLVQTAGLFVNKLLPSGSGAAGVSYLFLRANKVPTVRSAVIVALNNAIGFAGHATLFVVILLAFGPSRSLPSIHIADRGHAPLMFGLSIGVCLLAGALLLMKARLQKLSRRTAKEIRNVLRWPRVLVALTWSMLLTACYVAALYAACGAVHVQTDPLELLIVLTLSVGATAVVPVPGGIGAAEAGIFLGLRAYNIEATTALLIAFIYRLITFWVPLGVGALALIYVEKNRLLTHKK